jgi:hypothetical protein
MNELTTLLSTDTNQETLGYYYDIAMGIIAGDRTMSFNFKNASDYEKRFIELAYARACFEHMNMVAIGTEPNEQQFIDNLVDYISEGKS